MTSTALAPGLARKVKKVGLGSRVGCSCAPLWKGHSVSPLGLSLPQSDQRRRLCLYACRAQILETRTEAPEIVGSLSTLSQFYGDNTPAARRQLRSTIENEGVKINEDFLAAAEGVIQVCSAKGPLRRSWRVPGALEQKAGFW